MTTFAATDVRAAGASRALFAPGLAPVVVAEIGTLFGFYLLLPVVAMYATAQGAGSATAGAATGALMFATVLAELAMPWLLQRVDGRHLFAGASALLGAPAVALVWTGDVRVILLVNVIRGLGFGVVVVSAGTLVTAALPVDRRGEGLGLYGVVTGLPAVLGLPLGLGIAPLLGYPTVFALATATALLGLFALAAPGADINPARPGRARRTALRPGLDRRPIAIFTATSVAAGAVVVYLPLSMLDGPAGLSAATIATVAIGAHATSALAARWWAGRFGDRYGAARLLVPALLASTAGLALLAVSDSMAVTLLGMAISGAGFGTAQNATLAVLLQDAPRSTYGAVNAVWNLAYDVGLGVGAVGFGLLSRPAGYPVGVAVLALLMLTALLPDPTRSRTRSTTRSRRRRP